jgi:hypothetical protein
MVQPSAGAWSARIVVKAQAEDCLPRRLGVASSSITVRWFVRFASEKLRTQNADLLLHNDGVIIRQDGVINQCDVKFPSIESFEPWKKSH